MTELCVDQNMHTLLAQQYEPHLMKHLTFCQRASGQLALVNMLLSTENSFNSDHSQNLRGALATQFVL